MYVSGTKRFWRHKVRGLQLGIRKEVGHESCNVTDIEHICKDSEKAESAMYKFDHKEQYPAPQIFVLNTRAKSASVQGMDLYNTDLTMVAEGCDKVVERQVVGRILRQRRRPGHMSKKARLTRAVSTKDRRLEESLRKKGRTVRRLTSCPRGKHLVHKMTMHLGKLFHPRKR